MSSTTSSGLFASTGAFYITNGQVVGPTGQPFQAHGIDIMEGNQPSASTLQKDFPGINFVRLAIYDYANPASLVSYVTSLTSQGIVVELEDHSNSNGSNAGGSSGNIFTGSQLTNELSWYASISSAFKSNPYVWFGTDNEPSETNASGNQDRAALSTWQQQTYQAIRNTGNTSPIMLEANSWGAGQTNVGYTASAYAAMHDVIWDVHYYGWVSGYSTNQTTVTSTLSSITAQAQQITSADGTIPIIVGEYGNSTSGASIDPNATQVIQAVQASGYGYTAWAWGDGNPGDGLTSGSGLSSYGQQVAAGIAASAAATTTPTPTPTPTSVSGEITPASAGSLTDGSGNKWTLTVGGVVAENGNAVPDSAGTSAFALVNNAP
ncbi:MAG: mannan endo,4-beta-mannosidase, partial [Acetobacteraceae bacterium]|nr:mannan endo,4-beta-mannosidase [Acetobacteraceae bacterium]